MSHHWRDRLASLTAAGARRKLTRAERRQLRKLTGRRTGKEWRSLGHQIVAEHPVTHRAAVVMPQDAHFRSFAANVAAKGHVLQPNTDTPE